MATKKRPRPKKARGAARRGPAAGRRALAALAGLALFAGGLYLGGRAMLRFTGGKPAAKAATARPSPAPGRAPRPAVPPSGAPPGGAPPSRVPSSTPQNPRPVRLGLVIDDLGRSLQEVQEIAALGVPVTYAVLPFESLTPRVVEDLRRRQVEILCHLPMEPAGKENPGFGALREGMSPTELVETTNRALDAVPGAVGVNNHMGSEISADPAAMRAVLGVLAERGLYYLDSRTSAQSVGYREAIALGLPAAERLVFLDPEPGAEAVRQEFRRFLDLARERGAAIAIGHPHPTTFAVLRDEIPRARAAGFEFVPVSFLLDRPGPGPE